MQIGALREEHTCKGEVLRVSSSFSRVDSRKRHTKRAEGHSLLHNLLALTLRVLPAGLNMQLGALRELRGGSLAANSSFSRVRSRKRHEKRAAGHSLLHNLIALASMVRTATLNMQLGALRDQQQLRESCFCAGGFGKLQPPYNGANSQK